MKLYRGQTLVHIPTTAIVLLIFAGCAAYIVPVDSWEEGTLHSYEFEEFIGDPAGKVLSRIGYPTYVLKFDELKETYFVYERNRFVVTEVGNYYLTSSGPLPIPTGIDGGSSRSTENSGKSCYLLIFNPSNTMIRYEKDWIKRAPQSRTPDQTPSADSDAPGKSLRVSGYLDCREFFWTKDTIAKMETLNTNEYLRALSISGDSEAALEYAKRSGDFQNLDSDNSFAFYRSQSIERETFKQAWIALCRAANNRHGESQQEVGTWHRTSVWQSTDRVKLEWLIDEVGISPDDRVAYMWYTMAGMNGVESAQWLRDIIRTDMTPEEIAQAERLVHDWKPGDCPSAGNRLTWPGDT